MPFPKIVVQFSCSCAVNGMETMDSVEIFSLKLSPRWTGKYCVEGVEIIFLESESDILALDKSPILGFYGRDYALLEGRIKSQCAHNSGQKLLLQLSNFLVFQPLNRQLHPRKNFFLAQNFHTFKKRRAYALPCDCIAKERK